MDYRQDGGYLEHGYEPEWIPAPDPEDLNGLARLIQRVYRRYYNWRLHTRIRMLRRPPF